LFKQMLPSAALAAAVATALLFVLARWWKSESRCAGAIAIGAGYIAGHVLTAGWPPFPPRSATHWLFWFAVIGVVAAAADVLVRPKGTVRFVAWAIICTIACRLILQPKFSYAWSAAEGWLRVFAIALAIVVLTFCLDLVDRRPFGTMTLFSVTTVSLRRYKRRIDSLRQFVARTARVHSQRDRCRLLSCNYRRDGTFPSERRCSSS